ncbi:tumor necrosis factor receptor superfamily member 10A-like [Ochotona curzoniae]|uniref:tumor necrosis factor receptor superfamily member 10A-like n=1 Tax=Ochotona curzoniae TaxID=130825 RepID=UPI001B34964D|nr:tumor necrosis factor receptor superfamily member 10A-like [Ochotona curzoniae]
MADALWRLLLLQVLVAVASGMPSCNKDEYASGNLCCRNCPAGSFVLRACEKNHTQGQCERCPPGTHMTHSGGLFACLPCQTCREDQEMVRDCSPTVNRQCQCKKDSYASPDEPENCLHCSRCKNNQVLQECTPTNDTKCANDTQDPASSEVNKGSQWWISMLGVLGVLIVLGVFVALAFCLKRGGLGNLTELLKRKSQDPRSSVSSGLESSEALLSVKTEGHEPVLGVDQVSMEESLTLTPAAVARPGSADSETSPVPQTMSLEQAPQPQAALGECVDQSRTAASLEQLEQEFAEKYIMKPGQENANFKIHNCFEEEVDPKDWNMLMRCIGLEENDITTCEMENSGNVREQHMKMLITWRQRLGSKATVFRLMAALYRMRLDMALENFINKLVNEEVLLKRADQPATAPRDDPGPEMPRTPVDAALGPLRPAALTPLQAEC